MLARGSRPVLSESDPPSRIMKKFLTLLAAMAASLLLPSCLQNETTIHLKKDGSGTLVERTAFGAQMLTMLDQMASLGGESGKDPLSAMFSEDKARERAKAFGEGVTFEKSEPLGEGKKGATVTYRFTDINKLRVSPGESLKDLSPEGAGAVALKSTPVTFGYTGGKLTIKLPHDKPEGAADQPKPDFDENPQMEAMVKQMMGDMKMSFKLVVEPGIASTDASFREGNTVTFMEMDMGKVLEQPGAFKKLSEVDQNDPKAAAAALNGIAGVKAEEKEVVTVTVD